ncbi:hypothetical protein HG536_0C04180 [Torulaspora globosa]|uniref:Calponin-homology (CH) domain-containing protein n=1 Tax=Torulaspora globosa TaxID=48254 RepID=A0A7G3ZFG3_9SACH|nr:uncharacterized protein HG536_0C04180 [Torulaspora globosa]QLL32249.1 hypothetical protein HG536_0C04180 [Torulaspora globosa]
MSGIGESRTELLNWLNDLLQLNYRKIEECGTGAAYCQIMDSIYGDLPMHRVKFNATAEYEFQTNYKVLQSCFTKHHIEKTVYVEKLIRCRFQDNLEFLQWLKKYWVQNKDDSPYDAESRRKYRVASTGSNTAGGPINLAKRRTSGYSSSLSSGNSSTSNFGSSSTSRTPYGVNRRVSNEQVLGLQAELAQAQDKVASLDKEVGTYKDAMNIMERERDFYFGKLRDIEILVQSTQDLISEGVYNSGNDDLSKILNKVQQILYATEEGFEVNHAGTDKDMEDNQLAPNESTGLKLFSDQTQQEIPAHNLIIDEETF